MLPQLTHAELIKQACRQKLFHQRCSPCIELHCWSHIFAQCKFTGSANIGMHLMNETLCTYVWITTCVWIHTHSHLQLNGTQNPTLTTMTILLRGAALLRLNESFYLSFNCMCEESDDEQPGPHSCCGSDWMCMKDRSIGQKWHHSVITAWLSKQVMAQQGCTQRLWMTHG